MTNKQFISICAGLFSLAGMEQAYAACEVRSDTLATCESYVSVLRTFDDGVIFVRPSDDLNVVSIVCDGWLPAESDARLLRDTPAKKEMYATLLAAQLTNTIVVMNVEPSDPERKCDLTGVQMRVNPPPQN